MAEALELVKRHFGRGAVILNTRTVTRRGALTLGKTPVFEITAAESMADLPEALRGGTFMRGSDPRERAEGAATSMPLTSRTAASQTPDALVSQVGTLRSLVEELVTHARRSRLPAMPDELHETYRKLVENAVAEELARQLVAGIAEELTEEQLRDPVAVRACLSRGIEAMLPVAGPIRPVRTGKPKLVALIGPTGVGKTTTIAKLAANFRLRQHLEVGLITIDTYRIAAVEQLKTYAQIIDVPLEVAMTPGQLAEAVMRMSDRDIILIDTAGRSQRDEAKNSELRRFFDTVKPDEVHLVLSGTCSEKVLLETIQRFRELRIDRVIFTKLDEAIGFGVILACLQKAEAGLSYVTTGQDVPDDIHVGECGALADRILGRNSSSDGRDGRDGRDGVLPTGTSPCRETRAGLATS